MTKTLALIFLALLSLTTSAGVRTVGNGGGFGEMKAYLALQHMDRQIQTCFALPQVCIVNEQQKSLLRQVYKSMPNEKNVGLEFFSDSTLIRTVETKAIVGSIISINSNLLADVNGISESFNKISSYVLLGLLVHQQPAFTQTELINLSNIVATRFQETLLTKTFSVNFATLSLHQLQVNTSENTNIIFESMLLEDEANTYDLIAMSQLPSLCPKNSELSVKIKRSSQGPRNTDFNIEMAFSCDSKNWGQATLQIEIQVDQKGHIVLPIKNSLRGVIKPATGV